MPDVLLTLQRSTPTQQRQDFVNPKVLQRGDNRRVFIVENNASAVVGHREDVVVEREHPRFELSGYNVTMFFHAGVYHNEKVVPSKLHWVDSGSRCAARHRVGVAAIWAGDAALLVLKMGSVDGCLFIGRMHARVAARPEVNIVGTGEALSASRNAHELNGVR